MSHPPFRPAPRETLLVARRIHLLGDAAPVQALLLRDGCVAAAGSEAEMRSASSSGAQVVSLPDATVAPGITDAHVHLTAWAIARDRIDLARTTSPEEAAEEVRRAAARMDAAGVPTSRWLQGMGWKQNRWGRAPSRELLDAVCPGRPVYLESHDIHAAWVNGEALLRLGIDDRTPDPEGGTIVRDARGVATGLLLENAKWQADERRPAPDREEKRTRLLEAQAELHRLGITGIHSVEFEGLADFQDLHALGRLRLRVLQAIQLDQLDAALRVSLRSGYGDGWLRIGGLKMFLDGALGSRTAWVREPYEGEPENRGICTLPEAEFGEHARRAGEAGISSTVHAIGDAAVQCALDVLERTPRGAIPHRIEHVQLCPAELRERVGRSGIVASMQPVHLRTDIPAALRHWGEERSRGLLAFGALARAGAVLAFGSDAPVETPDPRQGLFAAVHRVAWEDDGGEPAFPEHAITPEQALRAYTEGPAVAAGEQHRLGRLLPGYAADLVAWDHDPLSADPAALLGMRAVLTVVGGEIVHGAP